MDRTHVLAAIVGAVAMYALDHSLLAPLTRRQDPVEPTAEAARVGGDRAPPPSGGPAATPAGPAPNGATKAGSSPSPDIEELRQRLAAAEAEAAIARGQLEVEVGPPGLWSDSIPPGFREEALRSRLDAALAGQSGMELLSLDCQEYPCIVTMRPLEASARWSDRAAEVMKQVTSDLGPQSSRTNVTTYESDRRGRSGLYMMSITSGNTTDADIEKRTEWRMRTGLEDLRSEMLEAEEPAR